MVASFILEKGMNWDFHAGGVFPRKIESLLGIFSMIFVHANWGHLANNLLSFEILSGMLFIAYRDIAIKILISTWFFSGVILWIIGRGNWHIGASGLIYALAFFLFFSGLIRKYTPLIAISLVVAFVYGNMIWHIIPWQVNDPISWEGHLSGGVVGLFCAIWFRHDGPQKPVKIWDNDTYDEQLNTDLEDIYNDDI
ncbi:MAG: rhomboid family intramembrane serine protease [Paludibacter sp.]|nr:rhomboid family intramembrane serine protease [Paludibacter sp.]